MPISACAGGCSRRCIPTVCGRWSRSGRPCSSGCVRCRAARSHRPTARGAGGPARCRAGGTPRSTRCAKGARGLGVHRCFGTGASDEAGRRRGGSRRAGHRGGRDAALTSAAAPCGSRAAATSPADGGVGVRVLAGRPGVALRVAPNHSTKPLSSRDSFGSRERSISSQSLAVGSSSPLPRNRSQPVMSLLSTFACGWSPVAVGSYCRCVVSRTAA